MCGSDCFNQACLLVRRSGLAIRMHQGIERCIDSSQNRCHSDTRVFGLLAQLLLHESLELGLVLFAPSRQSWSVGDHVSRGPFHPRLVHLGSHIVVWTHDVWVGTAKEALAACECKSSSTQHDTTHRSRRSQFVAWHSPPLAEAPMHRTAFPSGSLGSSALVWRIRRRHDKLAKYDERRSPPTPRDEAAHLCESPARNEHVSCHAFVGSFAELVRQLLSECCGDVEERPSFSADSARIAHKKTVPQTHP